ncbi:MAG: acetyl-CoA carboxylase biotin carboxyl carrier protein [Myxococcota bacterium]|jgi:acetyl-CoA carboxylase biotin carboxyl carrier protein
MDLERMQELFELLSKYDVSEFQYKDADQSMKLRVGAIPAPVVAAHAFAPPPMAAPVAVAAAVAPAAEESMEGLTLIESPMVGTFYRSPNPDSPAFVEVGTKVTAGDPLCIVEAMKLMNEIEAEISGTIVAILAADGTPVQFGQDLFTIRAS